MIVVLLFTQVDVLSSPELEQNNMLLEEEQKLNEHKHNNDDENKENEELVIDPTNEDRLSNKQKDVLHILNKKNLAILLGVIVFAGIIGYIIPRKPNITNISLSQEDQSKEEEEKRIIQTLENECQALQNDIAQIKEAIKSLEEEIQNVEKEIDNLMKDPEREKAYNELHDLQTELQQIEQKYKDITTEKTKQENTKNILNAQCNEERQKLENKQKEISENQKTILTLQAQIQEQQTQNDKLEQEEKNTKLKQKEQELISQKEDLQRQIEEKKKQVDEKNQLFIYEQYYKAQTDKIFNEHANSEYSGVLTLNCRDKIQEIMLLYESLGTKNQDNNILNKTIWQARTIQQYEGIKYLTIYLDQDSRTFKIAEDIITYILTKYGYTIENVQTQDPNQNLRQYIHNQIQSNQKTDFLTLIETILTNLTGKKETYSSKKYFTFITTELTSILTNKILDLRILAQEPNLSETLQQIIKILLQQYTYIPLIYLNEEFALAYEEKYKQNPQIKEQYKTASNQDQEILKLYEFSINLNIEKNNNISYDILLKYIQEIVYMKAYKPMSEDVKEAINNFIDENHLQILILDDNPKLSKLYKRTLEQIGIKNIFCDGEQILDSDDLNKTYIIDNNMKASYDDDITNEYINAKKNLFFPNQRSNMIKNKEYEIKATTRHPNGGTIHIIQDIEQMLIDNKIVQNNTKEFIEKNWLIETPENFAENNQNNLLAISSFNIASTIFQKIIYNCTEQNKLIKFLENTYLKNINWSTKGKINNFKGAFIPYYVIINNEILKRKSEALGEPIKDTIEDMQIKVENRYRNYTPEQQTPKPEQKQQSIMLFQRPYIEKVENDKNLQNIANENLKVVKEQQAKYQNTVIATILGISIIDTMKSILQYFNEHPLEADINHKKSAAIDLAKNKQSLQDLISNNTIQIKYGHFKQAKQKNKIIREK